MQHPRRREEILIVMLRVLGTPVEVLHKVSVLTWAVLERCGVLDGGSKSEMSGWGLERGDALPVEGWW